MSDIDYGQIQRSVSDSVKEVRSDIQKLSSQLQNVQLIDEIYNKVNEIENRVSRIEQIDSGNGPQIAFAIQKIESDITDLKQRFSVIEKFAQQFGEYLQAKYQQDKEDKEYRSS